LFSYLTIQQQRQIAIAQHQRHAADIAAALKPSLEQAIGDNDQRRARQLIARTSKQIQHVRVRLVPFDAIAIDRSPEGTQRRVGRVRGYVAQQQITTVRVPDPTGPEMLYTYVPLDSEDSQAGTADQIEISAPLKEPAIALPSILWTSLIALIGVASLSAVVVFVGGIGMVGKPLEQLIAKVQRVGKGDFSGPVVVTSSDELGTLGHAINAMSDQLAQQRKDLQDETTARLATVEQLRHAERLNTTGRMAAGIAHEIGTPLNVVSGRAELIASGQLSTEATRESAEAIRAEAQRIAKTIRGLMDFARHSQPQRTRQDLAELVMTTTDLIKPLATKHPAELVVSLPAVPCRAEVDYAQIQQVLTNLIMNAVQASEPNSAVEIRVDHTTMSPTNGLEGAQGQSVCRIAVKDSGHGIAPEDLPHVFEPFFTTKDVGQGTGLGLSISHGIIQEHDGWIDVASDPGDGSTFTVYLPCDPIA
ncbi:MAG: HAMP domain-containing sensor histidine kinase, partial [Planctomycetota bacterium]